mgnify:CR=1 FL=1
MQFDLLDPRQPEPVTGVALPVDGGYTANDPKVRKWAIDRSKRCADICRLLGTDILVLERGVDHRAVDGALGAELIGAFKRLIENPVMMVV